MKAVFQSRTCRRILLTMVVAPPLLAACATSDFGAGQVLREAEGVPDRFMVGSFDGAPMREATADEGCRSPMIDPRDGTRLRMVRSSRDLGDYDVPDGKYGAKEGELLRLDCATGEIIGLVAR